MNCRLCRMGFGLHLTTCLLSSATARKVQRDRDDHRPYWRPSRPRISRADYLASVATSAEAKTEAARVRQAAYRARQKAKASS